MSLNRPRIWQGGVVGGLAWIAWSLIVNMLVIGRGRYAAMQSAGLFLKEGRYRAFEVQWILVLFVLAILLAYYMPGCARRWARVPRRLSRSA